MIYALAILYHFLCGNIMNLETENRSGYLVTADIKRVWKIQMDLVTKLLEVCKKYNLYIWADSGTLIGTIRHKGYIPWDDDIDMAMMREDYDKLLSVAETEFQHPYFFQTAYSEKAPYCHGHAQLRMDGTTAILHNNVPMDIHLGIFIDIFVLDSVPKDKDAMMKMARLIRKAKKPLEFRMDNRSSLTSRMLCRWMPMSIFKERYKRMEGLAKTHANNESNYVAPILLCQEEAFLQRNMLNKEWYKETMWMPFEDILLPVPVGYDKILTLQYGDYMTPAKEPSMHGGFLVLDAERDYKYYLPNLRKHKREEKFNKFLQKIHLRK